LLKALRRDVFYNVEEFEGIVNAPGFARHFQMDDEYMLKKVPAPFPADSPAAKWTKHKSYTAWGGVPDAFFDGADAVQRAARQMESLLPFNRFLNYTVDESTRSLDE
jgi:hypothetical protein